MTVCSREKEIFEGGLSSIIVPKGFRLEILPPPDEPYGKLIVQSKKKRIKIKDLSRVKNGKFVQIKGRDKNWDDKCFSIKIKKSDK